MDGSEWVRDAEATAGLSSPWTGDKKPGLQCQKWERLGAKSALPPGFWEARALLCKATRAAPEAAPTDRWLWGCPEPSMTPGAA